MLARRSLNEALVSVGFDALKLRMEVVLDFLLGEEIFSLDDFEGSTHLCVCSSVCGVGVCLHQVLARSFKCPEPVPC